MKNRKFNSLFRVTLLFLLIASLAIVPQLSAAPKENKHITTPKEFLGHDLGEDYYLANYSHDLLPYWQLLAQQSNRIKLVQYGVTSGLPQPFQSPPYERPMVMAIISSPDNLARLDHYKEIAKRLALAEGLTDADAKALASEGKAVVWIDAGLHASEVINAQSLALMVYEMASQNDEQTLRILDNVIFLAVFSNPDGLDLCANWYMNDHITGLPQTDPLKRSSSNLPVLYQKYIAHDNNREYYTTYMKESQAISRVLYYEWFPQIIYNQHQSGPSGSVLFIGAMREPTHPYLEKLMAPSMEFLSSEVQSMFLWENQPGAQSRSGVSYQNWYNGGLRNAGCFHNMISILSEITGSPTPTRIAFAPQKLIATNDYPFPIEPQDVWHFSQGVDYLLTADRAFLDLAARNKERFLLNIYTMGKSAIAEGSRDNWTWEWKKISAFNALPPADRIFANLKTPANRDARGYIIPSDQIDFLTAIKFVNSALRSNITVLRATSDFSVGGKAYPKGSFIFKNAQAFRPYVMDVFEALWYPDDIKCTGGDPVPPYDMAGYTLGLQMGIKYDKIYEDFSGPFEVVKLNQWDGAKWLDEVSPPAGIPVDKKATGYLLSHQVNDSFIAVNRLLKSGVEVYWLRNQTSANGKIYPAGTMYIPSTSSVIPLLQQLANEKGLNFEAVTSKPAGEAFKLQNMRIGLADAYGGSSTEGWTQWVLEQFEFPINLVYPQEVFAGNLAAKYDVLIFEDGFIPTWSATSGTCTPDTANYAPQYKARVGSYAAKCIISPLQEFLNKGGTILTIESSTNLGYYPALNLPISNHVQGLPRAQYYVPGSVLEVRLDTSLPINYGMSEHVNVYFDNSPVFDITTPRPDISKIAWFDSASPLRSGWAWGGAVLNGGVEAIQVEVGNGTLFLFGPTVNFRAEPHGTYKWLFNGIFYGGLTPATL